MYMFPSSINLSEDYHHISLFYALPPEPTFILSLTRTKLRTDHFTVYNAGRIRTHGIGGGHKQRYRMIDFQRLHYEDGKDSKPFEEKVVEVRYDPCR